MEKNYDIKKQARIFSILIALIMAASVFMLPEDTHAASYSTASVKNLKVSARTYNSVTLKWDKKSGVTRYQVYRATSKNGKYKKIATTKYTSYKNSKLKTGKTYYYKVRAYRKVGKKYKYSKYSSKIKTCAKLTTPKTTITLSSSKPKIKWNTVSGAKGYQVFRAVNGGSYKKIKTVSSGTKTYTDSSAQIGRKYYYKVRAYRKVGSSYKYSSYSTGKSAVRPLAEPNVTLTSGWKNITAEWSAISKATKYQVYRSDDGENYTLISTTAKTSFVDSTALEGVTYYYKVRAYRYVDKLYNYSSYSNPLQGQLLQEEVEDDSQEDAVTEDDSQEETVTYDYNNYYLTYGAVTIHLNDAWSEEINANLNEQTGGSRAISYTAVRNTRYMWTLPDEPQEENVYLYCYDTEDFDNFLIVYVCENKIVGWKTNAENAGTFESADMITNEPVADSLTDNVYDKDITEIYCDFVTPYVYVYEEAFSSDSKHGYPESFDQYDIVIAGAGIPGYLTLKAPNIEQEEIIAEYTINAFRAAHGISVLEHNDIIYGNEEYGTKAYAKTMAMSNLCAHSGLTAGPYAGKTFSDRAEDVEGRCEGAVALVGENAAGDHVTFLGGGENLALAWYHSAGHKYPMLEFEEELALQGYSEACYMAVAGYKSEGTSEEDVYWGLHIGQKKLQ